MMQLTGRAWVSPWVATPTHLRSIGGTSYEWFQVWNKECFSSLIDLNFLSLANRISHLSILLTANKWRSYQNIEIHSFK